MRRKFEIKNTMGYRLCAFLDAETPLEIFRRLVVGSEGTLAFVAEAVFETVPLPPQTTVSWLHFASIDEAVAPVPDLVAAGASAVELMVAPALIVASHNIPGAPEHWRELPGESAALLVEFGGEDAGELDDAEARAAGVLAGRELLRPSAFTRDAEAIEVAWRVREGMFGLIGKLRAPGHGADHRGRLRRPRSDRRGARRRAGAARRARVPDRGRGPRLGREPPLHPHPGPRQPRRTASATRRSWARSPS